MENEKKIEQMETKKVELYSIQEKEDTLNDFLNKLLCTREIKIEPNSNSIAKSVTDYLKSKQK
jgi:hypothetical protein